MAAPHEAMLAAATPPPPLPSDVWGLVAGRLPSPLDQSALAGVCRVSHAAVAGLRQQQRRAARTELRSVLQFAGAAAAGGLKAGGGGGAVSNLHSSLMPGFMWTVRVSGWPPTLRLRRPTPSNTHQWLCGSYVPGSQLYSHANPAMGRRGLGADDAFPQLLCYGLRSGGADWRSAPRVAAFMQAFGASYEEAMGLVGAARLLARLSCLPAAELLKEESELPTEALPRS